LREPFILHGVLAAGVPFKGGSPFFPVSPFWLLTACLATLKLSVDVAGTLARACPNMPSSEFPRKHASFSRNRGVEVEKWKAF